MDAGLRPSVLFSFLELKFGQCRPSRTGLITSKTGSRRRLRFSFQKRTTPSGVVPAFSHKSDA